MAKKNGESTAVATKTTYAVMAHAPSHLREVLTQNVGQGGLSEFDLDRVKVPAGGGRTWSVPTLGEDDEVKSIEGVIIAWREPRSYWAEGIDVSGGGSPPDCSTKDGITGTGTPGGSCEACPLAVFGSSTNGRGQACKVTRLLFVIRPDDMLPLVIATPPSSLKLVGRYFLRLASRAIPHYGVITRFELAATKNKDGIVYTEIIPSMVSQLSPEETAHMRGVAEALAPLFSRVTVEAADVA